MNKRILSFIFFIFTIALLAALNTTIRTNEYGLTDISLDNIEALAQESGASGCQPVKGVCHRNGISSNQTSLR